VAAHRQVSNFNHFHPPPSMYYGQLMESTRA